MALPGTRSQPIGQRRGTRSTFARRQTGTVRGGARIPLLEEIVASTALQAELGPQALIQVRIRGKERKTSIEELAGYAVHELEEVRRPAAWAKRTSPSGLYNQRETTDSENYHVWHESTLEQSHLCAIAADTRFGVATTQALDLQWNYGGMVLRHVPDILVDLDGQPSLLVDVRMSGARDDLSFQAQVALTRAFAEAVGWTYELWDQLPALLASNLRHLENYSLVSAEDDAASTAVAALCQHDYKTVGGFLHATGSVAPDLNPASILYRAIWTGRVHVDLHAPIAMWSELTPPESTEAGLRLDGAWRELVTA
jgi:hypothetical protein